MTLNPVDPALLGRANGRIVAHAANGTADVDVIRRDWLLIDVDALRPTGISSTDGELAAARNVVEALIESLAGAGWPEPLLVMSGNGYQALYRVSLSNDEASLALVAGILRSFAATWDSPSVRIDTTVSNAARIAALAGTLKVKGDALPDRPHRRVRLERVPEAVVPVPVELLERVTGALTAIRPSVPAGGVASLLDAAGIPYRIQPPDQAGTIWYHVKRCPFHEDGRDFECGVGETTDGRSVGHCFHPEGQDRRWSDWRVALGLSGGVSPPQDSTMEHEPPSGIHSAQSPTHGWEERILPFISAREVGETVAEEVTWYVPGYVAAGSVTELVGKIKAAGKTTFVTHAVAAVVEGRPFLSRPTTRTGVLYLTEQARTSFRVALARAGLLGRDDVSILFWRDVAGWDWPSVVAQAVAECKRRRFGLLIVDTLPRFAGLRGDAENNAGDADEAMAPLQRAAADGLAVVVVRHERKAGGEVGDSGRGSSAFGGAVDIVLALKRGEGALRPGVRRLVALSRFDETPAELVIELGQHGYVELGNQTAVAFGEARDRLLRDLPRSSEEALTVPEIKALFEDLSATTIERARDELLLEGRLYRRGKGVKGDPCRYWAEPDGDDSGFDPSQIGGEFGQNESDIEDDYPRSAWDPDPDPVSIEPPIAEASV